MKSTHTKRNSKINGFQLHVKGSGREREREIERELVRKLDTNASDKQMFGNVHSLVCLFFPFVNMTRLNTWPGA